MVNKTRRMASKKDRGVRVHWAAEMEEKLIELELLVSYCSIHVN